MRKRSWWLSSNATAHACAPPGLKAWFCPALPKEGGSPICPVSNITAPEIHVVLLQETEGEGHGFAGGLAVALWHPWAGTGCLAQLPASCFLLSPCLHSCCSGTHNLRPLQPRASLHFSSPSSKKSLDFSLGSPRGAEETWPHISPGLNPWVMHSLTLDPDMADGSETSPPPQPMCPKATWQVGPALGSPVLAQGTVQAREGLRVLSCLHLSWRLTWRKPQRPSSPHSFTTSILTGCLVPS